MKIVNQCKQEYAEMQTQTHKLSIWSGAKANSHMPI